VDVVKAFQFKMKHIVKLLDIAVPKRKANYNLKTDVITYKDEGSSVQTFSPFDRDNVVGNIVCLARKNAFYLSSISSWTEEVIPHKLKYLGFKKFEVKKVCASYYGQKKYPFGVLYFYDKAEYAHFSLLMSDFIQPNNGRVRLYKNNRKRK
jgi:hypothetical protein